MANPNETNGKQNITLNSDFCLGIVDCVKRCQQALVQVLYFEEIPRKEPNKPLRYNVALSDGYCYFRAAFCHDASRKIRENHLTKYDIILVTKYLVSQLTSQGTTLVMITDYERKISGVKRIIGRPVYISEYKTAKCKNPFGANTVSYEELFEGPRKIDITGELYSQFIKAAPLEITMTSMHAETPPKHTASQSDQDKTKKKVNSMRYYNNDDKIQEANTETTPNEKLIFLHKSQDEENAKQTPNNKDLNHERANLISTSQRNKMVVVSEQKEHKKPLEEEEKKDVGSSTVRGIKIFTFAKQSDETSKRSPSSGRSSKEKPISILEMESSGPSSKPGSLSKDLSKMNLNDDVNTSRSELSLIIEIDEDEGRHEVMETVAPARETSREKKTVNKEQEVIWKKEAIKAKEPIETKKRVQKEPEVIEIEDFDDEIKEIIMYKIPDPRSATKPKGPDLDPLLALFHRDSTEASPKLSPFVNQRKRKQENDNSGLQESVKNPRIYENKTLFQPKPSPPKDRSLEQNSLFAVPKPVTKPQTAQKENQKTFHWDFPIEKIQVPPPFANIQQQQQQQQNRTATPEPQRISLLQQQQGQQSRPSTPQKNSVQPQQSPTKQQQQQISTEVSKPTETNGKDSFRRPSPFKLLPTIQVQPAVVDTKPQNEVQDLLMSYRNQKKDSTIMLPPAHSSGSKSRNSFQTAIETQSEIQNQMILPISELSYMSHGWVIQARVVQKSVLKNLQTKNGKQTTMFTIEIIDKDEGEIEVVFFGRACKSHFDTIHEGRVYLFSGGLIKNAAMQQQSNTLNDIQIVYESKGDIKEVPDDGTIPINLFKFSSIFEIQYKEVGEVIDFVGIIKEVGEMSEVAGRSGESIPKRNFFVYDKSCQPIEVTLWGDHCSVPLITDGMVVIKKVRVHQYLGRKCLVSSPKTMVITRDFPTQVKEISEIAKLVEKKTAKFEVEKKYDFRHFINEIIEGQYTFKKTDKHYFDVTASIVHIQNDLMSTLYYLSCTKEHCMKKVVPMDATHFKCLNCREITSHPKPRYTLSMLIADFSGSIWVNAFDHIGENILRQPASYIKLLRESEKDEDFSEFQRIMRTPISKEYNIRLLVKNEEFKGRDEWKCSILKIAPLSYADESKRTLQMLNQY